MESAQLLNPDVIVNVWSLKLEKRLRDMGGSAADCKLANRVLFDVLRTLGRETRTAVVETFIEALGTYRKSCEAYRKEI